jgi:hypothetical protein
LSGPRFGAHFPLFQAADTLPRVVRKAGFGQFTIVHDIQPRLDLQPNNIGHSRSQPPGQVSFIVGLSRAFGDHDLAKALGPGQAARVGGEYPLCASLHDSPLILPA